MVRFFYKEREAVNAKILKVSPHSHSLSVSHCLLKLGVWPDKSDAIAKRTVFLHHHLKILLGSEIDTKINSGTKIKLQDAPKTGDLFSFARGLDIGAECWSLEQKLET